MVIRAAALLALALGGCTAAAQGERAGPRPTLVSLNPCTDAILAEVADPQQILAISHYSQREGASSMDLRTARRFRAVGDSVEEVIALQPDVVVAGTFMPPATRAAFNRLGMRTELVGIASTVEDSKAQVRALAALAGHPERGEALVRRIDAALARSAAHGGRVPAVVWQSGGIVAGEGTLISRLLDHAGFENQAASRGMRQADLMPLERMLADPPRVIFTAGSDGAQEDRMLRHPGLNGLKHTLRAPLDGSLLYCGGPTIPRALDRLAQVRATL
ncbi:iron complex transport system substrate-binding protein [Novosphingobium kunmingense]|uniref:Iron complex transport system substrate-binding protein n=1 Tax=Novosphingobium kunmingense TaxID=1211806 RepID=A0A2N0I0V8_9SPHN|nr:iron complex transport system substrate-binding protein [Novosphingobium kunmingense]